MDINVGDTVLWRGPLSDLTHQGRVIEVALPDEITVDPVERPGTELRIPVDCVEVVLEYDRDLIQEAYEEYCSNSSATIKDVAEAYGLSAREQVHLRRRIVESKPATQAQRDLALEQFLGPAQTRIDDATEEFEVTLRFKVKNHSELLRRTGIKAWIDFLGDEEWLGSELHVGIHDVCIANVKVL